MEVTLGYSGVRQGTVADLDRMCITNAQRSAMRDFAKEMAVMWFCLMFRESHGSVAICTKVVP